MKKHTHAIKWRYKFTTWHDNPKLYKKEKDAIKAKRDLEKAYPFCIFEIFAFDA